MENQNTIFANGAVWLRADFHLHTKADKEFAPYASSDADFTAEYIAQLKKNNIGIGVVTNHNKFDRKEFKALKKQAKEEGIGLFAGVEYSVKEGIHILIVFEDAWYQGDSDDINAFLQVAFAGKKNFDIPEYPNSNLDLKGTVEALNIYEHGYFIILAHTDDKNGLFKVLSGRTKEDFIKQDAFQKVLGVQKSGNLQNYKDLCRHAEREIACVEGTDNAKDGIEGIGEGKKVSFLKVGDFNFDALQYALTDIEHRVRAKEKPIIQNAYIKSIKIEGGLLDGVKMDFSPELNCLIGVRGSGKSSILEILRYTLGIPLTSSAIDQKYKSDLIEHVLKSGGKSIVTLVNNQGETYRIEKIYGQKEEIYKGEEHQSGITVDAILPMPVYFGQKDLSNKDADFEADLIKRLIGNRLKEVQQRIVVKEREVKSNLAELSKVKDYTQQKKEVETRISNSEHQLEIFEKQGVTQKLQEQTQFDSDQSRIEELDEGINSYLSEVVEVLDSHNYLQEQQVTLSEQNKEINEELNQLLAEYKEAQKVVVQGLDKTSKVHEKLKALLAKLKTKKESLKEAFAQIKRELNSDTLNPDTFLQLQRKLNSDKAILQEMKKMESKRASLQSALMSSLAQLDDLWLEEYRVLQNEVARINEAENKLQITVGFKGNKKKFKAKLSQTFRGFRISDPTFEQISEHYTDFIQIYKSPEKVNDLLTPRQTPVFWQRFEDAYEDLLTYKVENSFTIHFDGKSLDRHSLGQRASALILFLLAQKENQVLLIDQPEDDLDNQTIYGDVIKEIKRLKGSMQFIFATHNANIPVLGDSEKVIACHYDESKIKIEAGTIDQPQTQKHIVEIMEGGKEAFKRRKNIYTLWKVEKQK